MQARSWLNPIGARESQKDIGDPVMGWGCRCQKGGPRGKCGDGTRGIEDAAGSGVDQLFKIRTIDLCSKLIKNLKRRAIKPDYQKPSIWGHSI